MNPYSNVRVGNDSMHSKSKKQSIVKNNSIVRKHCVNKTDLTCISKEAHHQGVLSDSLKEALEAFQVKLNNKQLYLAHWVRRAIPKSYDAMTTSPVESTNSHIKKRICALSLNNFSCSLMMITDGMYKFVYTN